ncbi:MAG: glycosyltransferase family 39 protein [Anaerolineae bacterium]|nr:glycosyltransferase family 39 protein [Anaerolineae bacterium]
MSSRVGYLLAVMLLLLGAALRMHMLNAAPVGFGNAEITDVQVTERVRQGGIEVFYDIGNGEGREGLYNMVQAVFTSVFGNGLFGYKLLSLWIGMLVLAVVYALAQRLFGPVVGVAALALLTTNMWMVVLSHLTLRETVLPLLVALMLLILARTLAVYRGIHASVPDTTVFVLLGVLLGLGFYIHPVHLLIVLFSMIAIAFRLFSKQRLSSQNIGYLLFSLLVMIIIAMPYLISTVRLPNLSGAVRIFDHYTIAENPPLKAVADTIGAMLFVGDANPAHNLPGRPLIDLVSGLLVLVGVLTAARQWRNARYALLLIASVVLLPAAIFSRTTPDFLAFTPLLPLVAIYFGLGISIVYRSVVPSVRLAVVLGAVVLFAFNLGWSVGDLFTVWPAAPGVSRAYHVRAGRLAQYVDQTAAQTPTVVCDSQGVIENLDAFSATDLMLLMMNRKNIPLRYADCGSGMIFVNGGDKQQVIMPDPQTLDLMQPYLRQWLDQGTQIATMPSNSVVLLDVSKTLADEVGRFTTTAPAGYAPDAAGGSGLAVPPVRFGGNLSFLGYEKDGDQTYSPGGIYTSITYWRVDGVVPPDLRFFTHILADPASQPASQNDTISVDVKQLHDRDVFIQVIFVPLPLNIPQGMYGISVGAYTSSDDVRMPVLFNDIPRGNRLFIGQITVQ